MPVRAFQEQKFLADLKREIQDSPLFDFVDDAQVVTLDREPEEGDVVALAPPSLIIIPSAWEPAGGLGGVQRLAYPARILCIAETLDVTEDEDRWTDETLGGARLRERALEALMQLGDDEDGAFRLSGSGSINYVEEGPMSPPLRARIEDGGRDLCIPELIAVYDIEY